MRKVLIVGGCGIFVLFILLLCYIYNPWVVLPTNSSSNKLTIVCNGSQRIRKIKMSHYVDTELINEYILELKIGLPIQTSQQYALPKVDEGRTEISVELEDGMTGSGYVLTVNYIANDVYKRGLLIYLTTVHDSAIEINGLIYKNQYVDFVSGKERISYCKIAGETRWTLTTDAPKLKKVELEEMGYSNIYNGWKENKWVKLSAE